MKQSIIHQKIQNFKLSDNHELEDEKKFLKSVVDDKNSLEYNKESLFQYKLDRDYIKNIIDIRHGSLNTQAMFIYFFIFLTPLFFGSLSIGSIFDNLFIDSLSAALAVISVFEVIFISNIFSPQGEPKNFFRGVAKFIKYKVLNKKIEKIKHLESSLKKKRSNILPIFEKYIVDKIIDSNSKYLNKEDSNFLNIPINDIDNFISQKTKVKNLDAQLKLLSELLKNKGEKNNNDKIIEKLDFIIDETLKI